MHNSLSAKQPHCANPKMARTWSHMSSAALGPGTVGTPSKPETFETVRTHQTPELQNLRNRSHFPNRQNPSKPGTSETFKTTATFQTWGTQSLEPGTCQNPSKPGTIFGTPEPVRLFGILTRKTESKKFDFAPYSFSSSRIFVQFTLHTAILSTKRRHFRFKSSNWLFSVQVTPKWKRRSFARSAWLFSETSLIGRYVTRLGYFWSHGKPASEQKKQRKSLETRSFPTIFWVDPPKSQFFELNPKKQLLVSRNEWTKYAKE